MLAGLSLGAEHASAQVIYVNAAVAQSGTGTGTWANAKKTLNEGLTLASNSPYVNPITGDNTAIIWVAEGDYYPDSQQPGTTTPQGLTFLVPHGVEIIGAFPKTGSPMNPDSSLIRHTILHGQWYVGSQLIHANNVVVCEPGTLNTVETKKDHTKISNLVIQDGYAAGTPTNLGGAIYCISPPTGPTIGLDLRDLIFVGNYAAVAGGAVAFGRAQTLTEYEPSWLGVYRCKFINNTALSRGGAIHMVRVGSTITDNFDIPTYVYNSLFRGNTAGIHVTPDVTPLQAGGAIFVGSHHDEPSISNNLFYSNSVRGWGSAIAVQPERATEGFIIANNTITQNSVLLGPDGIDPVTGRPTSNPGGAVVLDGPNSSGSNSFSLNNNIIWRDENIGNAAEVLGTSTILAMQNDIWFALDTQTYGAGTNINADPNFKDSAAGLFQLLQQPASPCIDAGDSSLLPEDLPFFGGTSTNIPSINYDYEGDPVNWPRETNVLSIPDTPGITDMGCYESKADH